MPRRSSGGRRSLKEPRLRLTDRRVHRTRRLLHKALMSLILEKKYEFITVQEVLDRADVGRSTFYMHFQDKDDLLFSGFQYLESFWNPRRKSQRPYLVDHTKELSDSARRCSSMPRSIAGLTAHCWARMPRLWCAGAFIPFSPELFSGN